MALCKLLLQKPSLLLLDEPTNHLDLETRNWLEGYLHNYPNGYILISHDRYFLDVTVDKTIEIWNKALHVYHGNYEKYLTQKEERRAQLAAAYKNQREHIEHLEAFITRFRYQATKANPATASLPVLAPALAFKWNYLPLGDISQYADIANGHMYPGGYKPSNEVSQITTAIRGSIPGTKPLIGSSMPCLRAQ